MFDVSLDSAVLLTHIAAGFYLVGSSLFAPFTRRALLGAPTAEQLQLWLDFSRRTTAANPPAAMVLLATGIYLGSAGWWSQGWFYVAAASWLVNSLLAGLVLRRRAMALAAAAARAGQGPVTPALDALRRSRAWGLAEHVLLSSDLAMIYVMFMKPSATESLIVVAGLFGICVGLDAALEARHGRTLLPEPSAR